MRSVITSIVYSIALSIIWQSHAMCIEHPVVIVIVMHNNEHEYKRTLDSIVSQKYDNKKVIIIDDGSTDNTYPYVQAYITQQNAQSYCTCIRSRTWQGPIAHIYRTAQKCADDDIIILMHGSDWLAHEHVLSTINNHYANNDVWLLYGQITNYPYQKNNTVPTFCTCYTWLFKMLNIEDLLDGNTFHRTYWHEIIAEPLALLASSHHKTVHEILCANTITIQSKDNQKNRHSVIHSRPLVEKTQKQTNFNCATAVLILSQDPYQLATLLMQIKSSLAHYASITILYHHTPKTVGSYTNLVTRWPDIHFNYYEQADYYERLKHSIDTKNPYTALCIDSIKLLSPIDLARVAEALYTTGLDIFYLPLGATIGAYGLSLSEELACIDQDNNIYAWTSSNKNGTWIIPTIEMTMFSTSYLQSLLTPVLTPDELKLCLHRAIIQENKLGLMFEQSKIDVRS